MKLLDNRGAIVLLSDKNKDGFEVDELMSLLSPLFSQLYIILPANEVSKKSIFDYPKVVFMQQAQLKNIPISSASTLINMGKLNSQFDQNYSQTYQFQAVSQFLKFCSDFDILTSSYVTDNIFCNFQHINREKAVQKSLIIFLDELNIEEFNAFYDEIWVPLFDTIHPWFLRCFTLDQDTYDSLKERVYIEVWKLDSIEDYFQHMEYGQYMLKLETSNIHFVSMLLKASEIGLGIMHIGVKNQSLPIVCFHRFYQMLKIMENSFDTNPNLNLIDMLNSISKPNLITGNLCTGFTLLKAHGLYYQEHDGVWQKEQIAWFYFEQKNKDCRELTFKIFNNELHQTVVVTAGVSKPVELEFVESGVKEIKIVLEESQNNTPFTLQIRMDKQGSNLLKAENVDLRSLGIKYLFEI